MNFLISDAWAQAPQQQPDPFMSLLPLILIFVVFYFLLIRPQMKRAKEHRKMVEALKKGDEAVTNGGLAGRISEVGENFVELEIAKNIHVRVERPAIAKTLIKGTLKDL
jgi:preprotein translocase subunit YajC